jgi:hypothetical protein
MDERTSRSFCRGHVMSAMLRACSEAPYLLRVKICDAVSGVIWGAVQGTYSSHGQRACHGAWIAISKQVLGPVE